MEVTENQTTEVVQDEVVDQTPALPDPTLPEGEAAEPEWKPNLKVKAYDKEFDIPEKFHALINKENEKDFRDAFEKAFALDVMKDKNNKIRAENETFKSQIEKEYAPVVGNYKKLERFIANNDYDAFFANIPAFQGPQGELKLQKWMLQRLKEKELPEHEQAVYNENRAAKQRAYELEDENNSYKQKFESQTQAQQQAAIDNTLSVLDQTVASPEIAEIAKEFDSRLGQDGSYKMEVLRRAAFLATKLQRDVSIEEAVADFNKMLGHTPGLKSQADPEATLAPQVPVKKPTLPSLNGKATSPATQKIKSIDDIRKLRNQMIAADSRRSRE